ncbi:divergent PAP2 family protein [Peptacetobacter sp.]|uniref:divergent PAP2 family protein n=1 Tax=Peptacetobacter sp. TaxID=2991975 RepID=UPI00260C73DF|nr:divergent PAP2 family protein [Peptacetobacter sp.]
MKYLIELTNNGALAISLIACILAQVIKVFTGKEKRFDLKRITTSGGMPSSHTSFVTSLATVVGMVDGFHSTNFAIAVVFAMIVMYDAAGVRRAVGKQATILNQMLEDIQQGKIIQNKKLKELIGHTPFEVLGGAILGIVVALILM